MQTSTSEPSSDETSPVKGGRTQRRAAANRALILGVARDLIASKGTSALTLDAVAEEADVAVQTIYNRVGGRSALLIAVAEQAMEENRSYMDAAYATQGPLEDRIRGVAAAYTRFARECPNEFRLLVEPPNEPKAFEGMAQLATEYNMKLSALLSRAMDEGIGRSDLDPGRLSTMLWASLNGILALSWRPGILRVEDEEIDALIDLYMKSMSGGLLRRN